jgi:hypothetical protein
MCALYRQSNSIYWVGDGGEKEKAFAGAVEEECTE